MFQVKICGVTSIRDAQIAVAAGADAVGLNFCATSPRAVEPTLARQIAAALPPGIWRVGVFVNSTADRILRIASEVGLTAIQVHGDEEPRQLAPLNRYPLIRAFRCRDSGLDPVAKYLEQCEQGNIPLNAVLLDAYQPGSYGGTGEVLDWPTLDRQRHLLRGYPMILAGGLRPDNVAEAIRMSHPQAVDTASGVESEPGRKDREAVQQFVAAALQALASSRGD